MKVLNNLDLAGNELQNSKLQSLGADNTSLAAGDAGRIYFNSTSGQAKLWDGTATTTLTNLIEAITGAGFISVNTTGKTASVSVNSTSAATANTLVARDGSGNFSATTITANLTGTASNASTLGGASLAQVRDFAQTTGTRTALSAISDFDTQVRTSRLDQFAIPTASVSMNNQQLTSLPDPVNPQDAANKRYADSVATGLDVKSSVRAATTTDLGGVYDNGTNGQGATLTASANAALPAIDTVSLTTGQRVLVKNQATALQNGIYTVTNLGSGTTKWVFTRATDADTASEVTPGLFTFVEEGGQAGSGWVLSATGSITLGTTALPFAQFNSGGATYTAGAGLIGTTTFDVVGTANRISVTADAVDIAATYAGQTSITTLGTIATGTWQGSVIALDYGGTGASTAAGARANLVAAGKASTNIGAGTSFQFAHGLGSTDVAVAIREVATGALVFADVTVNDANNVTVNFASAVTASAYRITVLA